MPSNFLNLKRHILSKSVADDFMAAKLEWDLYEIIITNEFGHCPCGKEIKEHCYLKNTKNGKKTWVGNVCVKKFMDIDSGTLFAGLRRVKKNRSARPNRALIEYAWKKGFLYGENEYDFLRNIQRKRNLSVKQLNWVEKINRRIVEKIVVRSLPVESDGEEIETDQSDNEIDVDSNGGKVYSDESESDQIDIDQSDSDETSSDQSDSDETYCEEIDIDESDSDSTESGFTDSDQSDSEQTDDDNIDKTDTEQSESEQSNENQSEWK